MIVVVLKSKKIPLLERVLHYENAVNTTCRDPMVYLLNQSGQWLAQFPVAVIERIEAPQFRPAEKSRSDVKVKKVPLVRVTVRKGRVTKIVNGRCR